MGAHFSISSKPKVEEGNKRETKIKLPVTPSLDELEKILDYKFKDKNLLQEAYIHGSVYYPLEKLTSYPTYERLEFIGDSILNVLIAKEIFVIYPELAPGPLSKLRAANVDNEKLARVALKHGFHRFLCHKNLQFADQIQEFSEAIMKYPLHSNGLIDPPKFLADIVESTIGAVYIDSNFSPDTVWKVFKKLLEPIITLKTLGKNPSAELQELCQKKGLKSKFVKRSCKLEKTTTTEALVEYVVLGSITFADGSLRKEIAQNRAAKEALDKLKENSHPIINKIIAQKRAAKELKEALDKHKQTLVLATNDDDTVKDNTLMVITPHQYINGDNTGFMV